MTCQTKYDTLCSVILFKGGKKFTAGDKLSDIEDKTSLAFNTKEKDEEVPANRYMIGAGHLENSNKKSVLSVVPYNPGSSAAKIPDTLIGGFSLDSYDLKYESSLADVEIVGGIKLDSTIEEVKKYLVNLKALMKDLATINTHILQTKYKDILKSNLAKMKEKLLVSLGKI